MNKFATALSVAGLVMMQSAAQAGGTTVVNVSVSPNGAIGSLHTARTSADSKQFIGCTMFGSTQSTATSYVACSAEDSMGHFFYCSQYSPAPQMVLAVLAINPASTLIINSDSSYHCTYILSSNVSGNL